MKALKLTVLCTVVAVACAGVYGALRNLPIVSGCNFYSDCPDSVGVAAASAGARGDAATTSGIDHD